MRFKNIPLSLVFISGLFIFSCKKNDPVEVSAVPQIAFEDVSPDVAKSQEDSLVFTLSYVDGDGDLGENDPNVKNVFITDSRIKITDSLRIQQLSPTASGITIRGKFKIILDRTLITDTAFSVQKVRFAIQVRDRAGHLSNTVSSSEITVLR